MDEYIFTGADDKNNINIPKKIHLTCKDKNNIDNPVWKECLKKYKSMYTDYEIIIHDNEDIYGLIKTYYPQYLNKIKQIKIGAVLADIFRYLMLYLEGGIYSDLDCEPIKRIDELLEPNFKYYHGDENRDNNYWIYKNKKKIINKKWDHYNNICNNCKLIDSSRNPNTMKCLGHDVGNVSTILCYEFHSDYKKDIKTDKKMNARNPATKIYGFQICQWFIISAPKQEIFLKMFLSIMNQLDTLINIKRNEKNYHGSIINITGPSGFTRVVMNNLTDKIKILPGEFFCGGGGTGNNPFTRNTYIKHHYTGSWC